MRKKILLSIVMLLFGFVVQAQYLQLPYACGFEDAAENSKWFRLATGANKWAIGTADKSEGSQSLYISSNGGDSTIYVNEQALVVAYRSINLPAGSYQASIDWKCVGELDADEFYVCFVPNMTETLKASSSNMLPEWVTNYKLLGGLYRQSTFKTSIFKFTSLGEKGRLVFCWRNNTANISRPGAVIDYVQISNDKCEIPSKIAATDKGLGSVELTWTGTSSEYEIRYKAQSTTNWTHVNHVNALSYTFNFKSSGVYDFWVRGVCGNDTSIWVPYRNKFVWIPSGCINYVDLKGPGTIGTIGTYDSPYQTIGIVDSGFSSSLSRHTVHYLQDEYDPRTNNKLKTVPEGSIASVRLGNWQVGAEAESLTFDYLVDQDMNILLMKYAVVLEDPNHDSKEQPRFRLEMFDEHGVPLNKSCGDADFVSGSNTGGGTWHKEGDGSNVIMWKEWTTLGLDLRPYIGKKISIRLTTQDCQMSGHYGYAYFTLSCTSAKITGLSCGGTTVSAVGAPDGFRYIWFKKSDPNTIVSTTQSFTPAANDTSTYICRAIFLENEACFFDLECSLAPRWPVSEYSYLLNRYNCKNEVTFTNKSYIRTNTGKTPNPCETYYWDFGDGRTSKEVSPVIVYPQGGTYKVKLTSGLANDLCQDVKEMTIVIPHTGPGNSLTKATICQGEYFTFNKKPFFNAGTYTENLKTNYGCDSTAVLELSVNPKYAVSVYDTICTGETSTILGKTYNTTGKYVVKSKSVFGCDSVVTLHLLVKDPVQATLSQAEVVCLDEATLTIPCTVSMGDFDGYKIIFGDKAKAAGFTDKDVSASVISEIEFAIPSPLLPDVYEGAVEFITPYCGIKSVPFTFEVLYPNSVIGQRWNDVLGIKNAAFNGGYEFDSFQWYKNGMALPGEVSSVLYVEEGLDYSAVYSAMLRRADDGVTLLTCGFTPVPANDVSVTPTLTMTSEPVTVSMNVAGVANFWNLTGVLISSQSVVAGKNSVSTPGEAGIYILELRGNDASRKVYRITVR